MPPKSRSVAGAPRAVEIITIGDELLLGYTIDTNGAYLARKLAEIGIQVSRRTSIGDEPDRIAAEVRAGLDRSGAVITTGGLGPTADDMSKAAVASVFGVELELDAAHVEWMRARWRTRFGREMPESNIMQAMLPRGAKKLQNNFGSAPGVFISDSRGRSCFMLPGVPREMRGMTDDVLVPLLGQLYPTSDVVRSRTLRTTGVAESLLGDQLGKLAFGRNVKLAYLPSPPGVDLRLTIAGGSAADADVALAAAATKVREAVGEAIYGEGDDDLAAVVLQRCREKKHTISVAESCTGGLLGARVTAIAGSSDVFLGGVIAYHNDVKRALLGVSDSDLAAHGAVSEPVARQMAQGALARFNSSAALAITGVAGPGGGTPEKPVGTVWVALALGGEVSTRRLSLIGDREEIRIRAAQSALEMLRRRLG